MAETAKPSYNAMEKNPHKKLNWTQEMDTAFERLKNQIANASALHLPDFQKPFVLITDASALGT